jgi:hypothetical protein
MSGAMLFGRVTTYGDWEPEERPGDPAVIDSCEDCSHPLSSHSVTVLDLEGRLVVATVCHTPVAIDGPGSRPCSAARATGQNPSGACGVLA